MANTEYATVAEAKAMIGKVDANQDTNVQTCLNAAAQVIDAHCNRTSKFDAFIALSTATARLFAGSGGYFQWIDECISVTSVAVKDSPTDDTYTAWEAADWIACSGDMKNPDFNRTPYDLLLVTGTGSQERFTSGQFTARRGFRPDTVHKRGLPTVQVTAKWGYASEVPPNVKTACLAQATRWWKRFQGSFSDTVASGEMGILMFRQKLDPDIAMMLDEARLVVPSLIRK